MSRPISCALLVTTKGSPNRAATSAANGVGARADADRPEHLAVGAKLAEQTLDAIEQMQTAFHLQQQTIRRHETHSRCKSLCTSREFLGVAPAPSDTMCAPTHSCGASAGSRRESTDRSNVGSRMTRCITTLAKGARGHTQLPAAVRLSSTVPRTPPLLLRRLTRTPKAEGSMAIRSSGMRRLTGSLQGTKQHSERATLLGRKLQASNLFCARPFYSAHDITKSHAPDPNDCSNAHSAPLRSASGTLNENPLQRDATRRQSGRKRFERWGDPNGGTSRRRPREPPSRGKSSVSSPMPRRGVRILN